MSVATLKLPFRSLAVPNYRRYFAGQIISLSGNWMQIVAEMWLVLRLTGRRDRQPRPPGIRDGDGRP